MPEYEERKRVIGLTFRELKDKNIIRCEEAFGHPFETWSINDWAVATFGEVGEAIEKFGKVLSLLNVAKKIKRMEDCLANQSEMDNLIKELRTEIADIVIYCDLWMTRLGGDLAKEIIHKFNEVSDKRGSTIKL